MNKKSLLVMVTLAIFNFCFLGTEYHFDNVMALFTDSAEVVKAQNLVLGVSTLGFVLYAFLEKILNANARNVLVGIGLMLSLICLFLIEWHVDKKTVYGAGMLCFFLMGIGGSGACYLAPRRILHYEHLGKYVGFSYAFGIFLQFVNNNLVKKEAVQTLILAVFMVAFVGCMYELAKEERKEENLEAEVKSMLPALKNPVISLAALGVCVFLMTLIFSTLDNAVTLVHSAGDFNIGQWPRLLLAISGILAGIIFDLRKRMIMPLVMYVITMLSVISIVVLQLGGSFVLGLLVFYISAGFFVVFFMVGFMDLSYYSKVPRLWAGMGRAINNLCAIVSTALTVSLLKNENLMIILVISLLLLACITVSIMVYYGPFVQAMREEEKNNVEQKARIELTNKNRENHFSSFVQSYEFTQRETEIMSELLNNRESVSSISEKLALSRASLYRHIEKMNEKTGTTSRVELIHFYHEWDEK